MEGVRRDFTPLCMSRGELEKWRAANNVCRALSVAAASPCSDCTYEFASEMRLEMRCNGTIRRFAGDPRHSARRLLQFHESRARRATGHRLRRSHAEVAQLIEKVGYLMREGASTHQTSAILGIEAPYIRELRRRAVA